MTTTSTPGVSGKSISFGANPIPDGVTCYLTGYAQAQNPQYATVYDNNNNAVASISSSGGIQPMSGSSFSFTANNGPYTITIGFDTNSFSTVLMQYQTISSGKSTYMGIWSFISEDQNDADFNDSTVFLSWNLYSG